MQRPLRNIALAGVCALLSAAATGCGGDSTGPDASKFPVVGTYDVTTTLHTLSYPTHCTTTCDMQVVPAGLAALSGTLTVADSVVVKGQDVILPLYSASMHENPCIETNPPCTGATFDRLVAYSGGYQNFTVSGDTMGVTANFGASGEMLRLTSGRFAGDSIVGTIQWYTFLGVASQYYEGTFVARRQR
jgi:hypothetical protein